MHGRVNGQTPSGDDYRAMDPELLDWVSATAAYGFVTAYHRFVAPLSLSDQDRYFRDGVIVARLYGVQSSPRSVDDFMVMLDQRLDRFEPHPIVEEFLAIIQSGKAAPGTPRFLHRALGRAAVSLLPDKVRARLNLGPAYDLSFFDRLALRTVAGFIEKKPDRQSAPCQASVRLGLPYDFLYLSLPAQEQALRKAGLSLSPAADAA